MLSRFLHCITINLNMRTLGLNNIVVMSTGRPNKSKLQRNSQGICSYIGKKIADRFKLCHPYLSDDVIPLTFIHFIVVIVVNVVKVQAVLYFYAVSQMVQTWWKRRRILPPLMPSCTHQQCLTAFMTLTTLMTRCYAIYDVYAIREYQPLMVLPFLRI